METDVANAGLPICAYNNPLHTKVDSVPELLAELYKEGLIVAVKECTGDVRRAYEIAEAASGLELMIGTDDVLLEVGIAGAIGWLAGYPNALPRETVARYNRARSGDLEAAMPLYRIMQRLLRWGSKTEFVQAIELSMDLADRYSGPNRARPAYPCEKINRRRSPATRRGSWPNWLSCPLSARLSAVLHSPLGNGN